MKFQFMLQQLIKKMVDLAWEIGNGVIFYLRPSSEMKETISKMQSKKKIDVSCQLITCVSENSDEAIQRAKKHSLLHLCRRNIS